MARLRILDGHDLHTQRAGRNFGLKFITDFLADHGLGQRAGRQDLQNIAVVVFFTGGRPFRRPLPCRQTDP